MLLPRFISHEPMTDGNIGKVTACAAAAIMLVAFVMAMWPR